MPPQLRATSLAIMGVFTGGFGGAGGVYKLWRFLARFIAPVAIIFIFLKAVGLLEFSGS